MAITKKVDIHGLTKLEAKDFLKRELDTIDNSVLELEVVHGHITGQVLQQFVRKEFKHPKIERKILTMNKGHTILLLNTNMKK